jgi:hypothetical protein
MGDAPIATLPSAHPYAAAATTTLDRLTQLVQAGGWWFNRELITLQPNPAGELYLPTDTLAVKPVDQSLAFIQRGSRMYDPNNGTYTIGRPVQCVLIRYLSFDLLPASAQDTVAWNTIHQFQLDYDGDPVKIREASQAQRRAEVTMNAENTRFARFNIFNTSSVASKMHAIYRPVRGSR